MSVKRKKRRNWSAADKMRIVLAGMEPGVEIAELCRREGIAPKQYYEWRNRLMSNADRVFDGPSQKPSKKEQRLTSELERCKNVIAEITAENLELKKTLSD